MLLPTTVSKFGNRSGFQAEAAVILAAIALHARGVGHIRSAHCSLLRHARLLFDPLSSPVVVGVGDNKHPVSEVGSAEGASRKYERENFVAFIFQTGAYLLEIPSGPNRHKPANILRHDPAGTQFAYDTKHFRPEKPRVAAALSLAGRRVRLAGKAAGDNVNGPEVELSAPPDVAEEADISEVLAQDCSAKLVIFHHP
jgi:hypothetical protein